jgi:ATP-dependent helicase HrpB
VISLPIDPFVEKIEDAARRARAVVVVAAPGAGKTTRVPPALLAEGRVILLQPRRVAARAIAERIAAERGWTLEREVGWQIRFERRFTAATRLLVVTEGILTARLQSDPLLSDFTTIVIDEFHERSIHADLAIALARQAWRARTDLRIVVMSATLDVSAVSAFLGDCPVIAVPGRVYPIDIAYAPGASIADAAADVLGATDGQILCFLPGASEIRRAIGDIERRVGGGVEIVPLHGSLDAAAQDLALHPSPRRRVVVATNIAETSLTVPGVTAVIDTGVYKVARYDAERGIDSLETERIAADSGDQRAGRAGRVAPGIVRRLWDSRDRLRPRREPDIHRIDLAAAVLDIVAWGGDPRSLEWFETPDEGAVARALTLLTRLGIVEIDGSGRSGASRDPRTPRLTARGEQVRRVSLHPRLARMLVAAGGSREMARACAVLSERHLLPPRTAATASDLLSALDRWNDMPPRVKRAADAIAARRVAIADPVARPIADSAESAFRRAVLAGYPDRVAQRREPGSPNVRLATGAGATIARESGVHGGEFLVALDVHQSVGINRTTGVRGAPTAHESPLTLIRIASVVEREWLEPTGCEIVHRFDASTGRVRAFAIDRYDALVLAERVVPVDPHTAASLLADAWLAREPDDADARLIRRLKFAGHDIDLASVVRTAASGVTSLDDVRLARAIAPEILRAIDRDAPESVAVPSGRHVRVEYNGDGSVSASVKLQELFGLTDTPRIGRRREPVVLSLLAPNGRPVQVTRDLRSFWDRTYPEVRKELRGRYPRHPWPENPWAAMPTRELKRKTSKS